MSKKDINEAKLSEHAAIDHTDCEHCNEDYLLKMRDKNHEFFIGLTTILQCLKFAEEAHAIPPIDTQWWLDVDNYTSY